MKIYNEILEFNGEWRSYQKRVLQNFDDYSKDGKIHIVAAPGSGKTTLGIELIRRLNEPAIVFVPTITIREQWVKRIKEAFLCEGINADDYLSQDLKNLKYITITTYQSLHSAMTKYQGTLVEEIEDDDEIANKEEVDYSDFELLSAVKEAGIKIMCLDECHHLRNEWWKALDDFRKLAQFSYTVSLTATPPYDDSIALWNRYIDMCGEIDEEITIPELVKEGSLCPHQDYVYFNYPTKEEKSEISKFENKVTILIEQLMNDMQFQNAILSHPCLKMQVPLDELLEDPKYLSSILIYLNSKGLSYPEEYQKILGYKKLEKMGPKWMEALLQGFLYDDEQSYFVDRTYYEQLIKQLKANGVIEKRRVCMQVNQALSKILVKSVGKCESIKTIVFHEYECMKEKLKLLILTDYIRKEYETSIGESEADVNNLGVIPFFEMLRRENECRNEKLRIGVLSGSMIVIPAEAKQQLLAMIKVKEQIHFEPIGSLSEEDYVKVNVSGEKHFITEAISSLFEQGYMQVLIGTKSLLGEGWDSPCVNTLILASFVGSFMLSNQMRGRAIRTYKKDAEKASHIWHLVCIEEKKDDPFYSIEASEDFQTLERRMENFLGLHYEKDFIENGMERLTAIQRPLTQDKVKHANKTMLKLSKNRNLLKQRWDTSLAVFDEMQVCEEVEIKDKFISAVLIFDALRTFIIIGILCAMALLIQLPALTNGESWGGFVLLYLIIVFSIFVITCGFCIKRMYKLANPLSRLQIFGDGILDAMKKSNLLESSHCRVETISGGMINAVYLSGGTGHDKTLFAKCVSEFFDEIENQRYLLYAHRRKKRMDGYFVIPDAFSKKKEDALIFASHMKPFIGKYEAIYTRNSEGRKILLQGRIHALANKENRCVTNKRIKNALE